MINVNRKLSIFTFSLALIFSIAGCSNSSNSSVPAENIGAVGSELDLAEEAGSIPEETETMESETTVQETTEEQSAEELKEIVPAYYEEQPDIPTVDSITTAPISGKGAMGPVENGKYLELHYSYRTDADGSDNSEAVISDYISFVSEQGFLVQEVTSPDEYAALNSDYHSGNVEDEKEIYHIFKDKNIAAALSYSEESHRLTIYLMDAWKPGKKPDNDPNVSKDTAYKTGTVFMAARKGNAFYDFKFTDGNLVSQSYEDEERKGGYGEDSSVGIEYSEFYGMTVEELTNQLQNDGYTVTTGDDLYDVMMKSLQ
ncbi:MAG: hypothetical protein Q4F24_17670 [Eubacteriales bacterium]|nr:hypothetical protein [Eubacteriales bacterium]